MRLGKGWENDGYRKIQLTPEVTLYIDRFNAEWDTDIYGWIFVHNTGENNPGTYLVTYNNIRSTRPKYKYNELARFKYIKSNEHRFKNFKTYKLTSFKDPTTTFGLTPIELCRQANTAILMPDFIIRDKKPIYFLSKVEVEDGYVGPYPRYPIDYGPKIDFERRQIEEIIKKKYYVGKKASANALIQITSIKNYSQGNIDDKELLKGLAHSFIYNEANDTMEEHYVHFEECKDESGQLFLKITPCKLAKNLKDMDPKEFVYDYYSKKYIEEESIKGEGNVSFRDMLKTELFEQLPEEQTKETLIPMEHKRFEDRRVDDTGLQELIEKRLGVFEDYELTTKSLNNEKFRKRYNKPYRCQDGTEINVKIATTKTLSDNLANALNSFDHGVENSL